jgi:hypothetical protein
MIGANFIMHATVDGSTAQAGVSRGRRRHRARGQGER